MRPPPQRQSSVRAGGEVYGLRELPVAMWMHDGMRLCLPQDAGASGSVVLAEASGQGAMHRCFDDLGREEGEVEGRSDCLLAATLRGCDLGRVLHPGRKEVVEPGRRHRHGHGAYSGAEAYGTSNRSATSSPGWRHKRQRSTRDGVSAEPCTLAPGRITP
jgi:hypothetical protein